MTIRTDIKTRVNLTITHSMKSTIEQLAREDSRSTNNLMILLMKEALEQPKWKERIERLKHDE